MLCLEDYRYVACNEIKAMRKGYRLGDVFQGIHLKSIESELIRKENSKIPVDTVMEYYCYCSEGLAWNDFFSGSSLKVNSPGYVLICNILEKIRGILYKKYGEESIQLYYNLSENIEFFYNAYNPSVATLRVSGDGVILLELIYDTLVGKFTMSDGNVINSSTCSYLSELEVLSRYYTKLISLVKSIETNTHSVDIIATKDNLFHTGYNLDSMYLGLKRGFRSHHLDSNGSKNSSVYSLAFFV